MKEEKEALLAEIEEFLDLLLEFYRESARLIDTGSPRQKKIVIEGLRLVNEHLGGLRAYYLEKLNIDLDKALEQAKVRIPIRKKEVELKELLEKLMPRIQAIQGIKEGKGQVPKKRIGLRKRRMESFLKEKG